MTQTAPSTANGRPRTGEAAPARWPLRVRTPLDERGKDAFRLVGFTGHEGISQLFRFQLDLLADNRTDVPFDALLGRPVTVELALSDTERRHFHGIVCRLSQGHRDKTDTRYQAIMVPHLWLLTKKAQSRIFQDKTVPQILERVLVEHGRLKVTGLRALTGFHPREYCVQYRETDFNFVSRLMEEEGIYYFFTHDGTTEQMVVANTAQAHPPVSDQPRLNPVYFEEILNRAPTEFRVTQWEKTQELRAGHYVLSDYCFEMSDKWLVADKPIHPGVKVGQKPHPLQLRDNTDLWIEDYPGDYAHHFDGVTPGGTDRSADLGKIFEAGGRKADLRMQQETVPGLFLKGTSTCRHFIAGHCFSLATPQNSNERALGVEGPYVLTSVTHSARSPHDRSDGAEFGYFNQFTCIPLDVQLPYRPTRSTEKPTIPGTQTAFVVGSGADKEEIFTDRYGRVRVKFHWDHLREGNDHSCWIRVAQVWAGRSWGASFWPRVGQEVVVAFEEGDPDKPILVGSVYNDVQRPPYLGDGKCPSNDPKHPNDPRLSGIKTCTTPGGEGFNELRFDDSKDKEQVFLHAQRDLDVRVRAGHQHSVGGGYHLTAGGLRELVQKDHHSHVKGEERTLVEGKTFHLHHLDVFEQYNNGHRQTHGTEWLGTAPRIVFEGGTISLNGPNGNFIRIDEKGVTIVGIMVDINSGGAPLLGSLPNEVQVPEAPAGADRARSGWPSTSGQPCRKPGSSA